MSTVQEQEPRRLADEKFDVVKFVKITAVLIISLLLWNLPAHVFGIEGLTVIEQRMISIFAFAALMWITEGVPAWVTSVLIIVVMLFTVSDSSIAMLIDPANYQGAAMETITKSGKEITQLQGLIPYKDIIAAFADPTVMLFMGGFILALVASKSGVDVSLARVMLIPFSEPKRFLNWLFGTPKGIRLFIFLLPLLGTLALISFIIEKTAGEKNPRAVLLGFMLVTAIFSMFISNTATAAMMLTFLAPVFRTLPENERGRVGLALAIPIGCNIGGIGTPIGTPPNGIALGALKDAGFNIGFLDWMCMMVPLMLLILVIAWVLLLSLYKFTSRQIEFKIEGGAKPGWQTKAIYVVMAMTIALWCLEKVVGINSYVVALFPVGAFTALGIVTSEDIKHIDWSVLWMVAGGFALGTGMKQSGLAKAMVESIPFAEFNVFVVLIGAGLLCWTLSTFISNSASAALMVPILITVGTGMSKQLAPIGGVVTLVAGLALSASFAMALPISTPPNAIAYSTGLVKTSQMAKVGIIMGVVAMTLAYGMLMLFGSLGIGIFG